nr:hypothetical protein [uncultured Rhodopila sp.]
MRKTLLATVLTVGLLVGSAGTGFADVTVIGAGNSSCGTWTAERQKAYSQGYSQWVWGFLSGIGYAGKGEFDPLHNMDGKGVAGWIDNYCRDHPIEDISAAAIAFFTAHPR